ncbi:hypothetical protein [Spirosoma spitsbergense]|jgi:hypothetical protein|uniref:hypothetical protein n=1 Tax=Spirosoma spitsbergense TaxID=431554 RepID=UPI00037D761C|nr:hypothetical protein [Spirosoma spitsbergense]
MKNLFASMKFLFLGLLVLSFTAYGQIKQTTPGVIGTIAFKSGAAVSQKIPLIYLDTLQIGVDVLFNLQDPQKKLDKDINFVFEFYVKDDAVTLHGWRFKRASRNVNQFRKFTPDSSDVFLTPIGKSSVAIGPDTYVNNQVFYAKDMKTMIQDIEKVRDRGPQLLFIPTKDPVTKRIRYNVLVVSFISASGGTGTIIENLTGATYQTNPSPPHQSTDN